MRRTERHRLNRKVGELTAGGKILTTRVESQVFGGCRLTDRHTIFILSAQGAFTAPLQIVLAEVVGATVFALARARDLWLLTSGWTFRYNLRAGTSCGFLFTGCVCRETTACGLGILCGFAGKHAAIVDATLVDFIRSSRHPAWWQCPAGAV